MQSHYTMNRRYQEVYLHAPAQSKKTPMAISHQLANETLQSPAMQQLLKSIPRIAASDLGILLVGEFGTGKEWLARKIHQMGSRAEKIFLSMDCTMLTPDTMEQDIFGQELFGEKGVRIEEGILEEASAGTVFFDGFTSLPTEIQMKVSRAVAHQKYHRVGGKRELWFNARTMVAINKFPPDHTAESALQREALSRITPIVIDVPPLRQRQEDLLPLINLFIGQVNERYKTSVRGIKLEALHRCMAYNWLGNIRELRNTIEYAVIMARNHSIEQEDLPVQLQAPKVPKRIQKIFHKHKSVTAAERYLIEDVIKRTASKKEAAQLLGISLKSLSNKLEQYHLPSSAREKKKNRALSDTPVEGAEENNF